MVPRIAPGPCASQVTMTVSAPSMASACTQGRARSARAPIPAVLTATITSRQCTAQVQLMKTADIGAVASSVAVAAAIATDRR
jgi:hypothetical protein